MELFLEKDIEQWQLVIARSYCKSHRANLWLFGSVECFFNFLLGCVGVGIAEAIADRDRYDEGRGSFYWFCCLKCFEVIRDELRKEYRRRKSFSQGVLRELYLRRPGVRDETKGLDDRDLVEECLSGLSRDQRDALLLVDYLGLPAMEASIVLKRSPDATYALLKRARRKARSVALERERVSRIWDRDADFAARAVRRPRDGLL